MARCTCRYCSAKINSDEAYKIVKKKNGIYFCNKEHYEIYRAKIKQEKEEKEKLAAQKKEEKERLAEQRKEHKEKLAAQQKEEREKLKAKKKEEKTAEEQVQKEKRKADKDKVYWLICEIIGRDEIINPTLYKEWKTWNKVASNAVIGKCLEDNKTFLLNRMSTLNDIEHQRILYISAVLKNKLGDYSQRAKNIANTPIKKVEETFYEPIATNNNKRRSLADLEDDF